MASAALIDKLDTLASQLAAHGEHGFSDRVRELIAEAEMPTCFVRDVFLGAKAPQAVAGKRVRVVAFDLGVFHEGWVDVVPIDKHENPSGPVVRVATLHLPPSVVSKLEALRHKKARGLKGPYPPGYESLEANA